MAQTPIREIFAPGTTAAGTLAYSYRPGIVYLNITNRCDIKCLFCIKFLGDYWLHSHHLRLEREPTVEEVLEACGQMRRALPTPTREVVFCGMGEPHMRLAEMLEIAAVLKQEGHRVRLDTNGLASLHHRRPVAPELSGLIDAVNVSLNAPDAETYDRLCLNPYEGRGYQGVKDFILECRRHVGETTASVVRLPHMDLERCRQVAEEELGVPLRVRG